MVNSEKMVNSENSSEFSDDEDFATQCYIIDLKTALNEKDAKILKLQKGIVDFRS